jgi:bleomycin hydrolase
MLKDNRPVWFGCDTVARMDSESGTMDMNLFLYEEALETKFKLDKAGRLDYGESKLNHAMVFTGVNLVNGRPNRWKVENSWGDKRGKEGYFTMSDKWFDEFMYQAVIDKKFLPDELKKAARQKPVVLPPWDPMGSLAVMR